MTEESFQAARKVMQRANYLRGVITSAKGTVAKWTRIESVHRENGSLSQAEGCKKLLDKAIARLKEQQALFADLVFPNPNIKSTTPKRDKCQSCGSDIVKGNEYCEDCSFIQHL